MYKVVTIGGTDYRLEYTIEASLYSDAVEKLVSLIGRTAAVQQSADGTPMQAEAAIEGMITQLSDIAGTALTLFYAGLLEYHGPEGDRTIRSLKDAKRLARTWMEEQGEDNGTWYDLLTLCINQMADDGFFKLIGLEKALTPAETPKAVKTPQDHKRKKATES